MESGYGNLETGIIEPWLTCEMPDLALIVTQILLKSQTLWGSEPEQLLVLCRTIIL